MLDNITKKNIDDCRDVLVGKVPDPKSQIEQITLALIYKFMDDMDKEAVDKFKGKAKFFTGEYAKYGWRKLFDPSLSGQDMLALYSEALEKLNTNPNIPELFRNIFKNAYLPYRDPSTLKLFLKYINEFEYNHSEKLGDAFEYLLSVMGSQGDAGQFRTPRHIIDFVTACVNPQKNETVLDPACGTAGFLLSAYKHILNQNTSLGSSSSPLGRPGGALKPDDRKKLATNFVGYDISPDMVRLSLANMYLHGFATPLIHEYDSLSSEDRWQETFDVILANPPFMTPKGGIRPHKKFGVQANKAEVLFTDYIAEHLNSNGRAGIVVPNGIVATSQTAYKQLRKMLVQDSLIAVISLPAGVFQPYSGVKTSVLILDKHLSKKSQHILFLKIENDGFDLGAQRKEIDKNDLPLALQTLEAYKECLSNDKNFENMPNLATLVEKEIVLGNKDVVLSAERYFETVKCQTEFELIRLGDEKYFKIESGGTPSSEVAEYWNGNIHWATLKDLPASDFITTINDTERKITKLGLAKSSAKMLPSNSILVSSRATIGRIAINKIPVATNQGFKNIVIQDFNKAIPEYVALILTEKVEEMNEMSSGSTFKEISKTSFSEIEIPLPPIKIQQQIVAEIECFQKIIDGAKQVVNNYKPSITINPAWEMVELDTLCYKITDGSHFSPDTVSEGFPYVTVRDVDESKIDLIGCKKIDKKAYLELVKSGCKPELNDVLFSKDGTVGKVALVDFEADFVVLSSLAIIRPNTKLILPAFLSFILQSDYALNQAINLKGGVAIKRVVLKDLKTIKIPKISFEVQHIIVNAIEEELQLVNANKRLMEIFEQKIKTKIGDVWGVKEEVE
jgi:type I restriction enzyme M protein